MLRRLLLALVPATLLVGCMKPPMPMEPPQKPSPAVEMKKLERLVGTWSGTAELVEPCPEEMKKMMSDSERAKFKSTFAFNGKTEWAFGGMALKSEGWFEMGENQKVNYVEYWTWNSTKNQYDTWYLSDWGEIGTGSVVPCGKCDGFRSKAVGIDAKGDKKKMEGCLEFPDNNTMKWDFTEYNPWGKMVMKGTSKRQ